MKGFADTKRRLRLELENMGVREVKLTDLVHAVATADTEEKLRKVQADCAKYLGMVIIQGAPTP